ncbi:MAG TPA: DedA family protein [Candidatus Dormibacteraeota bacterium]|jgi:membrane protein DedA with SNARE-associated domain|nr:DedA family protein [Candidatus Dormibacteraeota bacterium]
MTVEPSAVTDPADPAEPTEEGQRSIHITKADVFCLGPVALLFVWNLVMLPIAPSLLGSHPVLLSWIRGSSSAMIAAGAAARTGGASLWVVLLAPLLILLAADPFLYWAGRRYGRRTIDFLSEQDPRWRRRAARSERWFSRWGAWTIAFGYYIPFVPATLFYLAAGESRMRIRTFVIADLFGTMTWIVIHVGAGYWAGESAKNVAAKISQYGLWAALVIIVGAIGWSVIQYRRQPRAQSGLR